MATGAREITQQPTSAGARPKRVIIVSNPGLANEEVFPVLLNPSRLRYTINVEWSRLPVVGLDHEVPHYSRTRSVEVPFSFLFSAFEAGRQLRAGIADFDPILELENLTSNVPTTKIFQQSTDFSNFMLSLCFPTKTGFRPPTIKIIWPNVMSLVGVASNLSLEYVRFDKTLAPIYYQADFTLLETRLTRRFSEDVRQHGLVADADDKTVGDFNSSTNSIG